jgi:hypothetical protein
MTPEQIKRVLGNTDTWLADYAAAGRDSVLGEKTVATEQMAALVRDFTKQMAENYDRTPRRWTARDASALFTDNVQEWSNALNLTGTELAALLGDYVEFLEDEHHLRSAKAIATALIKAGVSAEAPDREPADRTRVDALLAIMRGFFGIDAAVSDHDLLHAHLPEAILMGTELTFTDIALLAEIASDKADYTVKSWLSEFVLPLFNLAKVKELLETQLEEKLSDDAVANYELTSLLTSTVPVVSDQRLAVAAIVAGTPFVTGQRDEVDSMAARYGKVMAAVPDMAKFIAVPKKKHDVRQGLSMKAAKKLRAKKRKRN